MDAIRQISILCLLCVLLVQTVENFVLRSRREKCPKPFNKHWCPSGGKRRFNDELSDRDVALNSDRPELKSPQSEVNDNSNDDQGGYLPQSTHPSYIPSDPESNKDYRKDEKRRCPPPFDKPWCGSLNKKSVNIELPAKEPPSNRDLPILDSSQQEVISKNNGEDAKDDFPLPSDVPPASSDSPTDRNSRSGEAYGVRASFMWKRILARLLEKEATEANN